MAEHGGRLKYSRAYIYSSVFIGVGAEGVPLQSFPVRHLSRNKLFVIRAM